MARNLEPSATRGRAAIFRASGPDFASTCQPVRGNLGPLLPVCQPPATPAQRDEKINPHEYLRGRQGRHRRRDFSGAVPGSPPSRTATTASERGPRPSGESARIRSSPSRVGVRGPSGSGMRSRPGACCARSGGGCGLRYPSQTPDCQRQAATRSRSQSGTSGPQSVKATTRKPTRRTTPTTIPTQVGALLTSREYPGETRVGAIF